VIVVNIDIDIIIVIVIIIIIIIIIYYFIFSNVLNGTYIYIKEPLKIPTGMLIFNDLSFKGFWMTRWSNSAPLEAKTRMFEDIADLVKRRKLSSKVTYFDINNWRDSFSSCDFLGGVSSSKAVLRLNTPSKPLS
jgi:hypothetical protein